MECSVDAAFPWDFIAGCYSVGMWCDVICIQGKAPVWSTQNGIQVFHIGIDPFRAGGKRRDEPTKMSLLEAVCRSGESRPGC